MQEENSTGGQSFQPLTRVNWKKGEIFALYGQKVYPLLKKIIISGYTFSRMSTDHTFNVGSYSLMSKNEWP